MRYIEIVVQWMFALFMAVVAFFGTLLLLVFLLLELEGLPIGTKPPPDFHSSLNPTLLWMIATSILLVPLFVASYVGAITAPNSRSGLASIVFPLSVFLLFNLPYSARANHRFNIDSFLGSGAVCAIAAACLYFRWKRQQSRRNTAANASLAAGSGI
jgi:hypothetical protein